ncbi:MAG: DsbA family protein [Campylobacteraceae bacterium]
MKQTNNLIAIALAVVIAVFCVAVFAYTKSKNTVSEENYSLLIREHSPVIGNKDAKVTVVEFFDPGCGTCVYFGPFVKDLPNKYDGKVKVVYRYLPFHNGSDFMLALVEAARDQGKFEEALSNVFEQYNRWFVNNSANAFLAWGVLQQSSVDVNMAQAYINANQANLTAMFQQDIKDATDLGITGTPTFYINGQKLTKLSPEDLYKAVEDEIKKVY